MALSTRRRPPAGWGSGICLLSRERPESVHRRPYIDAGLRTHIFDFELTREQLAAIDALDTGVRSGPEPDTITLENYGRPIPEAS